MERLQQEHFGTVYSFMPCVEALGTVPTSHNVSIVVYIPIEKKLLLLEANE